MTIERKKRTTESKPSKSPTSIAEDPGALATIHEMGKSKAWSAKAKAEGNTEAIKTAKKKAKSTKSKETPKAIETQKKKSEDSQNGVKIQPEKVAQKKGKETGESEDAKHINRQALDILSNVEEYAAELAQKSRYREKDPKKIALGIFLVLPECEDLTQEQFAKHFKISRRSVNRYLLDKTVIKVRNEFSEIYFKRYTPKIINHLVKGAQKTSWVNGLVDTAAIKLFLQYVEKWNEKQEVDVTSDGKAITWGLAPSQFVKKDQIPDKEEEEDEDAED